MPRNCGNDVPVSEYRARVERLRSLAKEENVDGFFIYADAWRKGNVRYLSGYSPMAIAATPMQSALVFLPVDGEPTLYVGAPMFANEAREISWIKDIKAIQDIPSIFKDKQRKIDIGICGMDLIPVIVFDLIRRGLPNAELRESKAIYRLRLTKSPSEIALLRRAAEITDEGIRAAVDALEQGKREDEIARTAENAMISEEPDLHPSFAFSTVIMSGPHSEYIIWRAGRRRIRNGDFILLDFGAIYKGYTCDIARTVGLKLPKKKVDILDTVIKAHVEGRKALKAEVKIDEVDKAARAYAEHAGYGKYFLQTGYHATGMEQADVMPEGKETVLQPNMTFNVLSALFVPRLGGARIEDNMVVKHGKAEQLTKSEHELYL